MATSKSSSKITRKLNLQLNSNIELFPTHMELKLAMLDVDRKLVKDIVNIWRWDFGRKKEFSPSKS
jgi:hypothetical protein